MSFGQHIYLIKSQHTGQDRITNDWGTSFYKFLELLLSRLSGEKININVIDSNDLDIDKIYSPFALLIPILSNDLLSSSNFNDEIKLFHEKSINKSENNISWNSRIFKVLPEPQEGHFLLDYLSNSVSYNFFHHDTSTDELVLYDDFTGPTSEKTFWMRLYDLAYDIFKVMDGLKNIENEIANINKDLNSFTVYLSAVGADLLAQRDAIKRELLRSGYKVLPEKNMPQDLDGIMKLVRKDLSSSNMSIHLIGSDYGKIPSSNVSIIDLQNRMAVDHFKNLEKMDANSSLNFSRVIWVSPELNSISVKQRLFIENLKKDSDSIKSADLIESSIEELKAFVINKIQNDLDNHEKIFGGQKIEKEKIIYLIHDQSETRKCKKIETLLSENGFNVILSDFEGNPDEVRNKHNDNLRKCDASLIYYGKENDGWIKSKQNDLLKSLGLGREKPISPQAILIENESQLDESLGIVQGSIILQSQKIFTSKVIEPFLAKLRE